MIDFVIIVAGGIGKRMGGDVPKQFLLLNGTPLLMKTIEVFHQFDPKIKLIVTLPKVHIDYWHMLCTQHHFALPHHVVEGGDTRFHSVKNGLSAVTGEGVVAVHDGVRPLVSRETLERCFDCARKLGNAVPVVGMKESLRMKQQNDSVPVDRDMYYVVQTPQVFKTEQLLKAYGQSYHPAFTDDASVVERSGVRIQLVEGNSENIKITTKVDMMMAESLLKNTLL